MTSFTSNKWRQLSHIFPALSKLWIIVWHITLILSLALHAKCVRILVCKCWMMTICKSKRVVLFRVALFLLNACLSQNLFSIFSRCNNTCTSFSKCYIIKQLLTNEALDMMWYRPDNTNIDRGERIPILTSASPRSILVLSGRYHIISNATLVNNCIILNIKNMLIGLISNVKIGFWIKIWDLASVRMSKKDLNAEMRFYSPIRLSE